MKRILSLLALMLALCSTQAHAQRLDDLEINLPAQGVAVNKDINMTRYRTSGVQAVYSDGTPAAHTIISGARRIATLTVSASSFALISAYPSVGIYMPSTSTIQGKSVTIKGVKFTEGTDWIAAVSTLTAAARLGAKIDAHPDFIATVSGATVTVKYATYGTSGNGIPITTDASASYVLASATLTGGAEQHSVIVNDITLTETTDWTANLSSRTTAGSITSAINANATLLTQVTASSGTTGSVVTITPIVPGASNSYYTSASTPGITVSNFTAGLDPDINITSDRITKASHGLQTGLRVFFSTVSQATAPGGLTNNTTYWAIKLNDNIYQLATSSTNAIAGTAIDITSLPSTASTYNIVPLSLVTLAQNGFKWQGSNDGTNFSDLSIASVTYSAAGNTLWDLDDYAYKWLRMVFSAPTSGGIAVAVRVFGLKD